MVELQGGSIVIDGVNIREIGLTALRERLAFVPQDSTLFVSAFTCPCKVDADHNFLARDTAREHVSIDILW
jgi:ABC-type transport system involved in Fe-S cluster assembly fused permease/ATPase subunit